MLTPVIMHKANKYAIDPSSLDDASRTYQMKNYGCSRKVHNLYVDFLYNKLEELNYQPGELIPDIKLPLITDFKKQYPYLKEVDSLGLANAKLDFEKSIKRYNEDCDHTSYTKRALRRDRSGTEPLSFRGLKGMPKFHSKANGDFSYTTNCQYPSESNRRTRPTVRLEGNLLYFPKCKKPVKLILHRPLPKDAVIKNVTFSMDTDGMFYASIGYTYVVMMDMNLRTAVLNDDKEVLDSLSYLGLDYSQDDFYVDNEGRKANYPHYYRQSEEKLAKLQHELSKMEKDSNNYKKQQDKIARLHKKIRNQRKDFVTKKAVSLAREYDVVIVEDINLRAMGECLKLGKNLHDNGFGMFRNVLSRKLEEKGSVLVKIDKWYPSTQTCHCCGYVNKELTMSDRDWTCPECGTHHDRDENAAINIQTEGKRIFPDYFREWLKKDKASRARAEALSNARKRKKAA